MTTTVERDTAAAGTSRPPAGATARTYPPVATVVGVFAIALALRLFRITRSYNLFIDEVTYTRIGDNLASGHGLTLSGQPFNLHPPVGFALIAATIKVFGIDPNQPVDQLILDLRPLAAVCGALIAVGALVVVRLCGASIRAAVLTAAAVALDPFQISFDSRVMLESFAQLFAVLGVALLLVRLRLPADRRGVGLAVTVGAGIACGLVFATKETFGLVVGILLLLLIALPRVLDRRTGLAVLGTAAVTYLFAVGGMWVEYGVHSWWAVKTAGLRRLIGTEQITGFNSGTTTASLSSRVVANLDQFAITYVALAAGGVLTLVDLVRHRPLGGRHGTQIRPASTLVSLWCLAGCGYLLYATLLGSLEEQMYYIPLLPCLLRIGLSISSWHHSSTFPRRTVGLVAGLVLVLGVQTAVWGRTHHGDVNLYERFLTWQRSTLPVGTRIGVTDQPASFMVTRAVVGEWPTVSSLIANRADYVVVDSALVDQGYSNMSRATLTYLREHTDVAFEARSGSEVLYVFDLGRL